jgi:hypothetical protein
VFELQNFGRGAGSCGSVLSTYGGAGFLVASDALFLYPIRDHKAARLIARNTYGYVLRLPHVRLHVVLSEFLQSACGILNILSLLDLWVKKYTRS